MNLFVAQDEKDVCESLVCIVPRMATSSSTCGENQAGATITVRSSFGATYFVEVVSFSPQESFDQSSTGTTGFVRLTTAT
jgi:hypothetical protein